MLAKQTLGNQCRDCSSIFERYLWQQRLASLVPLFRLADYRIRQRQCEWNLKVLRLAFLSYHDTYGCFPPAYVADANGKPMYSWRALLSPLLVDDYGMNPYNFSQPWSENRLVLDERLAVGVTAVFGNT